MGYVYAESFTFWQAMGLEPAAPGGKLAKFAHAEFSQRSAKLPTGARRPEQGYCRIVRFGHFAGSTQPVPLGFILHYL
jgi:hypothetical protein